MRIFNLNKCYFVSVYFSLCWNFRINRKWLVVKNPSFFNTKNYKFVTDFNDVVNMKFELLKNRLSVVVVVDTYYLWNYAETG